MNARPLDLHRHVGVWLLPLNATDTQHPPPLALLTPDERDTLAGYASASRRREFALSRLLLRLVLRNHGFDALATTSLDTGAHGKPAFLAAGALCFNLSHAHGMAVLAVGGTASLGIDIEPCDRNLPSQLLAPRYCHPAELEWLSQFVHDETQHRQHFLRLWVRKEAVLKARGDGVHGGPRRIDAISVDRAAHYHDPSDTAPERWELTDLDAHEDYFISVARAGSAGHVPVSVTVLDGIETLT